MTKLFPLSLLLLSTVACSQVPTEAYYNRGTPESLLDVSSDVVNVNLSGFGDLDELTRWVERDQPSRAELHCVQGDPLCNQAQNVLGQYGVPVQFTSAGDNNVTLIYEKVSARDCDPHYINNAINPYNLNHPTFGCSVAANMVQMVSDKEQFTNPGLLDPVDAQKAVGALQNYYKVPDSKKLRPILQSSISSSSDD